MADITDQDIEETKRIYGFAPSPDVHTDDDIAETKRLAGVPDKSDNSAFTPSGRRKVYITPYAKPMSDFNEQIVGGMPIVGPLMDKTTAATGALIQMIPGAKTIKGETPAASFADRYDQNLKDIQANQKQYQEQHPVLSTGANVVGATLATAPLAATKVGGALLGTYGPSIGSQAITGAVGNSLLGATDAGLRGEDPIKGGIVGGVTGLGAPTIGAGVNRAASGVFNYLWPRQGVLQNVHPVAINQLVGAMEGETPASIATGINRAGPSGFLGDISPRLTDIAGGLADTPGGPSGIVRQAYLDRASGQAQRIDQALTQAAGPKFNPVNMRNMITEERANAADPLYQQFQTTQIQPTPAIKALIPRLENAGAFNLAEEIAGIEGKNLNRNFFTTGPQKSYPTAETWSYVKQGLNRRIDAAYDAGDKTLTRSLIKLKQELRTELGKTPGGKILAQADNEFSSYSNLLDNLESGRNTFLGGRSGISKEELAEELKSLSYPEYVARVQGMRQAADQAMNDTLRGDSTLRNKLLAPNNQAKIRLLLPGKRGEDLIKALENEAFIADKTSNVVGNLNTGASGAMRSERVNALKPPPPVTWDIDLTRPMTLIPPRIREEFRPANVMSAWQGRRYANAMNDLARLITTRSGPQMNDLLTAISQEAQRRAAVGQATARVGNALTGVLGAPTSVAYRRNNP